MSSFRRGSLKASYNSASVRSPRDIDFSNRKIKFSKRGLREDQSKLDFISKMSQKETIVTKMSNKSFLMRRGITPLKVDDFVTVQSRNISMNTSSSNYSVFSNSQRHLMNSQVTPNDKFLNYFDQKFRKLKNYVNKLKSPKEKPYLKSIFRTLDPEHKPVRKLTGNDSLPKLGESRSSLLNANDFAPDRFKAGTPRLTTAYKK